MMNIRARWGARISFAALLLTFSELVVWQAPGDYGLLAWLGLAPLYLAFSAIALDLIARLAASDAPSLLLLAGAYGLANGTLISHVATRDLPLSLLARPLGAQPLAFLGALAAWRLLLSGRGARLPHLLAAAIIGLAWGVWVRWAPGASDGTIPPVSEATALIVSGLALVACLVIARLAARTPITRREDWLLAPVEWAGAAGVLVIALAIGRAQNDLSSVGVGIVLTLIAFMLGTLVATRALRGDRSALDMLTPPRDPLAAGWIALVAVFLGAGWVGAALPGSGDHSTQGDLLIGLLTGFGVLWLPVVSALIGVRAFVQLAREQV